MESVPTALTALLIDYFDQQRAMEDLVGSHGPASSDVAQCRVRWPFGSLQSANK